MILKEKTVEVRKPRRCNWCGEKIESGDFAKYRSFVWEGEFGTDYMHPECNDAMGRSEDIEDGYESCSQLRGKTVQESEE